MTTGKSENGGFVLMARHPDAYVLALIAPLCKDGLTGAMAVYRLLVAQQKGLSEQSILAGIEAAKGSIAVADHYLSDEPYEELVVSVLSAVLNPNTKYPEHNP